MPANRSCARFSSAAIADALIGSDALAFERKLYVIRKRAEQAIRYNGHEQGDRFYIASLSSRTIVYKGMLLADQVDAYYPDLLDPDMEAAIAVVHSRFSTNTFPSWERAHPYRYLIHNGEINTIRGNVNWMYARQSVLESELFGDDLEKFKQQIIDPDGSDSAQFDNALEFLHLAGRPLHHVAMMMIPEPWSNHESMSPERKAFYEYHATLMEPWDGPASIAFTDGTVVGAVLDRNGLRPSRYYVTKDDMVVMASEVGVLGDADPAGERCATRRACSRGACSWSTRRRAASSATKRSRRRWPTRIRTRSGWTRTWSNWTTCRRRLISTRPISMAACCTASTSLATPSRRCARCWRPWPRMASRRWAAWATTRRLPCSRTGRSCSTPTSASSLPRSPTRRWTPSARNW